MVERKIRPRHETEVYLNKFGDICIKQIQQMGEEVIIFLDREAIPQLIEYLQATYTDALDFEPDADEEEVDE